MQIYLISYFLFVFWGDGCRAWWGWQVTTSISQIQDALTGISLAVSRGAIFNHQASCSLDPSLSSQCTCHTLGPADTRSEQILPLCRKRGSSLIPTQHSMLLVASAQLQLWLWQVNNYFLSFFFLSPIAGSYRGGHAFYFDNNSNWLKAREARESKVVLFCSPTLKGWAVLRSLWRLSW